jgi:hypothetical protein
MTCRSTLSPVIAQSAEYGLVLWVRGGQVASFTPVVGVADEVWLANTRGLLAAGA